MVYPHAIRAVLFDLDGVLVHTDRYHYLAWKRLADEQGWAFDEEVNHQLRGVPRIASLEAILRHNGIELDMGRKLELADRKNEMYKELLKGIGQDDLYPGAVDLLERLRSKGVLLGLCSASKNAGAVLDALDLRGFFSTVVTGHDFSRGKPDPEIFLVAADRLKVPPFHCLVFEDAASGVEAALAAGMKCVGVGTPDRLPTAGDTVTDYTTIDVEALLNTGRIEAPAAEPWTLAETHFDPRRCQYWESLLALSNGRLGLRGTTEEDDEPVAARAQAGMFVNGVYDYRPYHYEWAFPGFPARGHAMVNLPDWRIVRLYVDGERFSPLTGEVSDYRRELDMRRGVVTRGLTWRSPAGRQVRIRTSRLVSMTRESSAVLRYEVTPVEEGVSIRLESVVNPSPTSQVLPGREVQCTRREVREGLTVLEVRTRTAPFRVGVAIGHKAALGDSDEGVPGAMDFSDGGVCTERFTTEVPAGVTLVLDKHAAFTDNLAEADADVTTRAVDAARSDLDDGFDRLRIEQEQFWADHWAEHDVEIEGDVFDQQMVRFACFHLRQSCPTDGLRSIGANALTGDKYGGHVFWDTEMYISPYLLYTDPRLVRGLLSYRHGLLPKARERAREMDGRGALFAWNSISGEECGVVYEASTAEYHLLSAIAHAIERYVRHTGDETFLREQGAEVLFETARFLCDRGAYVPTKGGRFCLNVVCGPDEYACGVNNNCYTNVLARWHFQYASEVYEHLRAEAPEALGRLAERIGLSESEVCDWRRAAERMYVPYDEELGIHAQDDSFLHLDPVDMSRVPRNTDIREQMHPLNLWRVQIAKQADVVLLMFVMSHLFPREQKRANYAYYEPRTCHGSSLSACIHSIVASEIGLPEDAYAYFRQSAGMDVHDFKQNTAAGVHAACLGGTWMAVVNGFAGMRDEPEGLRFDPRLPAAWRSYRFRIAYRGRRIGVEVNTDGATFDLLEGDELDVRVGEETIHLRPGAGRLHTP